MNIISLEANQRFADMRELKKHLSITNVYIPLEYQPGEYEQFDWGEAFINLTGNGQKFKCFVCGLPIVERYLSRHSPINE